MTIVNLSNIGIKFTVSGEIPPGMEGYVAFAKYANCENRDEELGEPCNNCPSCKSSIIKV